MGHYSYPLTDRRERQLDRLMDETDVNNKSDAIDIAISHYLKDKANKQEHWRKFTPEQLELLNTEALKVSYYPKFR